MHALRLLLEVVHQLFFGVQLFFRVQRGILLDVGQLRADIGHDEQARIFAFAGNQVEAFFGQLNLVVLLVNREKQRLVGLGHLARVVLEVVVLHLLKHGAHAGFAQKLDERLALGQSAEGAEQHQAAFALFRPVVALLDELAGFHEVVLHLLFLGIHYLLNPGLELVELVHVATRNRTRDDERRPGVVNEHRVHFVDHGVVVLALHQLLRVAGHVVAQVVEAEFVVGAVGDVSQVSLAAGIGVGLVLVDAIHRDAVELEQRRVPLRVALGQVVVHCYQVDAALGQRIEEGRQG